MIDWSTLQKDALESISKRVDAIVDYVSFRSVCTSWRSSAPKRHLGEPWVLIYRSAWDKDAEQLSLSSCSWGLTEFYGSQLFRPRLSHRIQPSQYICGCSRGWIALLDDHNIHGYGYCIETGGGSGIGTPGITLLNPFTGARIGLPRLRRPRSYLAESTYTYLANNLILSTDPVAEPHNCIAMALAYSGVRVIWCRLGADSWTVSQQHFPCLYLEDIMFFKGRCYIVSGTKIFVCDVASNARFTEITSLWNTPYGRSNLSKMSRLVVSSGDLLLVITLKNGLQSPPHPYTCEVFRVDLSGEVAQLVELQELGGRVLFLGSGSASLSAAGDTDRGSDCLYVAELQSTRPGGTPLSILNLQSAIFYYDMKTGAGKSMVQLSEDRHQDWWSICWLTPNLWEGSSTNHGTSIQDENDEEAAAPT